MPKIACITTLKAAPGRREELAQYSREQVPLFLKAEPGTLRIDILIPHYDSDAVIAWDVYESPEALEAHRNGTTLKSFLHGAAGLLISMSGVRHTLID
jgi:quinol monooxygenase YgiN